MSFTVYVHGTCASDDMETVCTNMVHTQIQQSKGHVDRLFCLMHHISANNVIVFMRI